MVTNLHPTLEQPLIDWGLVEISELPERVREQFTKVVGLVEELYQSAQTGDGKFQSIREEIVDNLFKSF